MYFHIIGCPDEWSERMHSFAGNSSFCQAHEFEVLTPTSTYCQFLSFVCFICQSFIPSKILSSNIISCNVYYTNRIFKSWEFYHSCPSAGNNQSVHIDSFAARHMRSHPSAGHTTVYVFMTVIFSSILCSPSHSLTCPWRAASSSTWKETSWSASTSSSGPWSSLNDPHCSPLRSTGLMLGIRYRTLNWLQMRIKEPVKLLPVIFLYFSSV